MKRLDQILWISKIVITGAVFTIAVGCTNPVNGTNKASSQTTTTATETLAQAIASIPPLAIPLPGALGHQVTTSSRAVGDVTPVSASDLSQVRSSDWESLQSMVGVDPLVQLGFKTLASYAASHPDLKVDQTIDLGTVPYGGATAYLGKVVIEGAASDYTAYDYLLYPPSAAGNPNATHNDNYVRVNVKWIGQTEASGSIITVDRENVGYQNGAVTSKSYSHEESNTATGSGLTVFSDATDMSTGGVLVAGTQSNGDYQVISVNPYTGDTVAWSNSTEAGIAAPSSTEYYDGAGDLLMSEGTSSLLWLPQFSQDVNAATLLNLSTAPTALYLKAAGPDSSGGYSLSISSDNSTFVAVPGVSSIPAQIIYSPASNGSLSAGDVIFGTAGTASGAIVYKPAFTVPAQGASYEFYPLVGLLPVSQSYSSDTLERIEGNSTPYFWIDWDGSTHNSSWTNYSYFLSTTGASAYQPLNGDISLPSVITQQVFRIDPSQNLFESSYAPMYYSSDGSVPPYFAFNDQATISDIKQHLAAIEQNDVPTVKYSDYESKLVDISGLSQYGMLE